MMTDRMFYILHILALLGTGLIAGTFLAFSSFIVAALERLPPAQGITAMQSINVTVINPLFMGLLFGTAILSAYLGYHAYRTGSGGRNTMIIAAALVYIVGAIGTTMVFNVPLNDALAGLDCSATGSANVWRDYVRSWTFWNSARAVAAAASTVMLAVALG
jgi:uncharacterized membrane protein